MVTQFASAWAFEAVAWVERAIRALLIPPAVPLHHAHGLQSGDNLAHRVAVRAIVKPYVTRRKFDFEDYWRRT